MHNRGLSDEEIRTRSHTRPQPRDLPLEKFVNAPCLVVEGQQISRATLIKYACNKLGGAHYDSSRTRAKSERFYRKLDSALQFVQVAGKPIVYLELLATGQLLVKAPDVDAYLKHVASLGVS